MSQSNGKEVLQKDISQNDCTNDSLWTQAYKKLREADPQLADKFDDCLGIRASDVGGHHSYNANVKDVAHRAITALEEASTRTKDVIGTSAKILKWFERGIKLVIASKDFVSAAASTNPYAAVSWTGVSLLLPVSIRGL